MGCQTSDRGLRRRNELEEVLVEKEGRHDSLNVTARSCHHRCCTRSTKYLGNR
jgi:hypothetical protein